MVGFDTLLNPVLMPVANTIGPFWTIVLVSVITSLISVLAYKYFTNQSLLKEISDDRKAFQKRVKEAPNTDEKMRLQKEMAEKSMEKMGIPLKESFKPMLITLIPILIIFGWMNANLVYEPIFPDEIYDVSLTFKPGFMGNVTLMPNENTIILNDKTQIINSQEVLKAGSGFFNRLFGSSALAPGNTWSLKSKAGTHNLTFSAGTENKSKEIIISKEFESYPRAELFNGENIESIQVGIKPLKPLGSNFNIPLLNWNPEWLGIYFILSMILSIVLRKALNVY